MTRRRAEWIASAALWVAACGDSGGDSSSASGSTSGASNGVTESAGSTSTSGASDSVSATAPTEGGQSVSDSQATTGGVSVTDSTVSDSFTSSESGTTSGTSASTGAESTTSGTTGAVSVSDSGSSSGGSSDTGEPLQCVPPAGYDGPKDPACAISPQVGTFDPVTEWSKSTWAVAPTYNQVMAAPIVVSLTDDNGDGKINDEDIPDIVFTTFAGGGYSATGVLRAVSGKDGAEILNIQGQVTGAAGVAGGDIDGDGLVEIVSVAANGAIKAFENTGELKWTTAASLASAYAGPAIADMDGDGKVEVIAGKAILNGADGTVRGMVAQGTGLAIAVIADLDSDGVQEYIAGNAAYGPNGQTLWSNGKSDGWVGIADVNLDATPDIIVTGGGRMRLQTNKGAVVWDVALPTTGGGPPTIADYDGDGEPEIGVAGATAYVVLKADGKVLWSQVTKDASSQQTGSSVFDFEGDGAAEVIYNDELSLRVYSGTNGAEKLKIVGHGSGTIYEYPLVVDVDGDGQSEIVVINNNYAYGTKTGVTVIGDKDKSWRPTRKIWNQHAYSITNTIRVS